MSASTLHQAGDRHRPCSVSIRALLMAGTLAGAASVGGCDADSPSIVNAPGAPETPKTAVLEKAAGVLQDKPPVEALNAYLDGFHFYNGNLKAQMEAHHYCAVLNDEVIQCVIFDGNMKDAKLMGVEYIVSERLFVSLPAAEKPLWHSHVHEVKSGQLIAPGIPQAAEHALMKKLVGTYGKTFHTWHTDLDKELPTGVPQVMMGFTADGQVDAAMVAARDQRFGIDSAERKRQRSDIAAPPVAAGADAWTSGKVLQLPDPVGTAHQHSDDNSPAGAPRNATPPR